ncbi:RICIN domain-containing protein [Streptomyces sp. NPDC047072]|uniref:RICIN domain-containing protein n=1 Tax=Streptomyces sp. NPDC047072 TaxID=3154809 RepID=UPI0033CB3BB6
MESVAGGAGDRYRVRNANSNRCLAIPGANPADTTQAIQWTCTTGTEQVWTHDSLGRLRNLATDKCLAIPGSTTTIGAKAIQWPCSTNTDQRWTW